jgi:hypothetical protein
MQDKLGWEFAYTKRYKDQQTTINIRCKLLPLINQV